MSRHHHSRALRGPATIASPLVLAVFAALMLAPASLVAQASASALRPGVIPPSERYETDSSIPVHFPPWWPQGEDRPTGPETPLRAGDPDDEAWWPAFAPQRVGSTVLAAVVYNGDLIIGGDFVDASGQAAFHVARWSESSWQPLGDGFNDSVFDLTVLDDQLIAAGSFTQSGADTVSHIATWNGVSWQRLGDGLDDVVVSVAEVGGQLYAGGYFDHSGSDVTELNGIAKWEGSSWTPLGSGVAGASSHVNVVGEWNGDLVIGGSFSAADGHAIRNLARWEGSTWVDIGGNFNERVYDFTAFGSDLIVGGLFTRAGDAAAQSIARFDGTEWKAIDRGMDFSVLTVLAVGDTLYAGGLFTLAGDTTAISVARADLSVPAEESNWTSLGSEMNGGVARLLEWDGRVIAVGIFSTAGGETVNYVAQWQGSGWGPVGNELNGTVRAMLANAPCPGCDLVVAGDFTSAGGSDANRVAAWSRRDAQNPESWSFRTLGDGFNGTVRSLIEYRGELFAGGVFTFSDTLPGGGLARWSGDTWEPVGKGIEGSINDATVWNDRLIVAGNISRIEGGSISSQVAAWDGNSFTAVGATLAGVVNAVEVYHDSLFIGGTFRTSSFDPVPYLGKSVEDTWVSVRSGTNGEVRDLEVYDGRLFVGGLFTEVDGSSISYLTAWDGQTFSADVDDMVGTVETLHAGSDFLHVGGDFFIETDMGVTSSAALYTSRSGWFRLGTGPDRRVLAISTLEGDIYLGGEFQNAGGQPSPFIARYLGGLPVPVQLSQFSGKRSGPDIQIEWRVGSARDHAGFHLYRSSTSTEARITPSLIRHPSADGSYVFADRTAPTALTLYWLEEIALDGTPTLYGPIEVAAAGIRDVRLVQNFSLGPNPFQTGISLRFRVTQAGTFHGSIHDVLGRRIGEIPARELAPGDHVIAWDGSTLSGPPARPGVYFASLRFDVQSSVRRGTNWTHTSRVLKLR